MIKYQTLMLMLVQGKLTDKIKIVVSMKIKMARLKELELQGRKQEIKS